MLKYLLPLCVLALSVLSAQESINRAHIPYLAQKNNIQGALELYRSYHSRENRHDFEILTQLGTILLEKGAQCNDAEEQLLALYGSAYASLSSTLTVLETAIKSAHLQTQLAAVHLMARFDDDRCHSILNAAMSSEFLYTRMEAAQQLCLRKSRSAVGQIEALMHRVPRELRVYFPPFFGLIGTSDGTKILKSLLDDADEKVRVEAILSVARNHHENLLPFIRCMVTHPGLPEQEASAYALGELGDAHSLPKLKKMMTSSDSQVRLSAARALYLLGEKEAKSTIVESAHNEDLYAINLLSEIADSESTLQPLLTSNNLHVRFGAALALLKRRDPSAVRQIKEMLVRDPRDLGFYPMKSAGGSLVAWKVIPSVTQHQKKAAFDLKGMTISLRESILRDCLELPEWAFLEIAEAIFYTRQFELIPLLVRLVENLESESSLALLKRQYRTSGVPLIRAYSALSLYRLKKQGPFEKSVRRWLEVNKGKELIRFRKVEPKHLILSDSPYELTPEEHSRLLIETLEALANRHEEKSLDLIVELLEKGNPKNRYLLAGLLLKALQ